MPHTVRSSPSPWPLAAALAVLASGLPHARANTSPCMDSFGTGTATDVITSLTWQTVPPMTTYAPSDAATYCSGLILDGNGPNVWRLPTVFELQTIVHEGRYNPAIDTITFTMPPDLVFWTQTPVAAKSGYFWGVDFTDGQVLTYDPAASPHSVRCVH